MQPTCCLKERKTTSKDVSFSDQSAALPYLLGRSSRSPHSTSPANPQKGARKSGAKHSARSHGGRGDTITTEAPRGWWQRVAGGRSIEKLLALAEGGLFPGAVVRELGRLPRGAGRDPGPSPRPLRRPLDRRRRARRAAASQRERDASLPDVVGPDLVRVRLRHRRGDLRAYGPGGARPRGPRHRALLRGLRPLRHALGVLLHGVRRRDPGRRRVFRVPPRGARRRGGLHRRREPDPGEHHRDGGGGAFLDVVPRDAHQQAGERAADPDVPHRGVQRAGPHRGGGDRGDRDAGHADGEGHLPRELGRLGRARAGDRVRDRGRVPPREPEQPAAVHAARRPGGVPGRGDRVLRVRRVRQHRDDGGGDAEPVAGHPAGPAGLHVRHHGHLLRDGAGAEHDAAVHGHRPERGVLGGVRQRGDAVGAVRGGPRRAQGDDHRAAGGGAGPGAVHHAHRAQPHHPARVRARPPQDGHARARHHAHRRRQRLHRALLQPRRALQPHLRQHAIHLHDSLHRAPRPTVLRAWRDEPDARAPVRGAAAADHRLVDRDRGVLGHVAGPVGGVRGAGAGVGGRHAGNPAFCADGADPQGVGRAAGAVAALALHRHQPLPHGIARQGRLHPVRRLHRHHAHLLRARRPPRHLRRSARRVRRGRGGRRYGRRRRKGEAGRGGRGEAGWCRGQWPVIDPAPAALFCTASV